SMPTSQYTPSVTAVGDAVYSVDNLNYAYDPRSDTWAVKTSVTMPEPGDHAAAAALGGKVYLMGGYVTGYVNTCEVYDPVSNAWGYTAALPTAREYLKAGAIGGKIYAVGGWNGSYLTTNEMYDPLSNTWTPKAPMPTARYGFGGAALNGRFYAVGGYNGALLQTGEVYDPGTAHQFGGLLPNHPYTFSVKARNGVGAETGSISVSTRTLAAAVKPASGISFPAVTAGSITAAWDDGGGNSYGAESFLVQASTSSSFLPVASSAAATGLTATLTGLSTNTLYFVRVQATNADGETDYSWTALGSTYTAIEAPTSIVFDEVSSAAITASAYAPSLAFSSMSAGVSGTDVAMTAPTASDPGWHGETWKTWSSVGFAATDSAGAAALGGKVYVVGGGADAGADTAATEVFDPVANQWTGAASMHTARNPAVAALGGKLYALGGCGNFNCTVSVSTAEAYNPETDTWTVLAPMPTSRAYLAAVAVSSRVLAIGGNTGSTANEAYDPATDAWSSLKPLTTALPRLVAADVGGIVYAVGSNPWVNEAYDPSTNLWASRNVPSAANCMSNGAAVGGKLYVVCEGQSNLAYDPGSDSWAVRSAGPTLRQDAAVASLGALYFIGGYHGADVTTNEAYDPGVASRYPGLAPNTLYTFQAKARNADGAETVGVAASTYTLAVATGPVRFTGVFQGSITVTWSDGGGGANQESFAVEASTMASFIPFYSSTSFTTSVGLTTATLTGLAANTTYYLRVQAYNAAGVTDYGWVPLGSTATLAAAPTWAGDPFVAGSITGTSIGAQWTALPASPQSASGEGYELDASTAADFSGAVFSSATNANSATGLTVSGLGGNTTYYFRLASLNWNGLPDFAVVGATATLGANPNYGSLPAFYTVWASSAAVTWSGAGNPLYVTTYTVVLNTIASFTRQPDSILFSTAPQGGSVTGLMATVSGLQPNTTYWYSVETINWNGVPTCCANFGSSVTAIGAPTSIVFDDISSSAITASAYAPGTAFSSMTVGLSGTDVSIAPGVGYAGWHGESWSGGLAGLPLTRNFFGMTSMGGRLYVAGGAGTAGDTRVYDPVSNGWATLSAMSVPRYGHGLAAAGGKLYAVGGQLDPA
ncbi:MAG: fibronectin type III domain-containing protein, partial [Elusimicrobia bacterium]|nr:fibronectin type III domain-containing protein [Elusimicrobiota bacterium]